MSELKIRPLYNRIVVQQSEVDAVSAGGIVLVGTDAEKPREGKVLAVGKGNLDSHGEFVPLDVKAGDKILFGQYVGLPITIDDMDYLIFTDEEIIAILV